MRVSILFSFALLCFLVLISCKKHSSRWLTGDIHVVDAVSGEPVRALIELEYYEGFLFGSEEAIKELGYTDDDGYYELEEPVGRKDKAFKINVHAVGPYGIPDWFEPDASRSISNGKHNVITLEVKPVYLLNFNLTNVSCYDDTDSMWLKKSTHSGFGTVFVGCLTDSLMEKRDHIYWADSDTMSMRTISKKNGAFDTLIHQFDLVKGYNTFDLNY